LTPKHIYSIIYGQQLGFYQVLEGVVVVIVW